MGWCRQDLAFEEGEGSDINEDGSKGRTNSSVTGHSKPVGKA